MTHAISSTIVSNYWWETLRTRCSKNGKVDFCHLMCPSYGFPRLHFFWYFGFFQEVLVLLLFSSLNINTYTVTLKIRSKRNARRTDSPKDPDLGLKWVQTTSKTLAEMTRQSKRLNDDSKYILGPRAHIRNSISKINSPRKKNSAMSVK